LDRRLQTAMCMRKTTLGLLLSTIIAGCNAAPANTGAVGVDPAESVGGKADGNGLEIPEVRCAGVPDARPKQAWNDKVHADLTKTLGGGQDNHRGIDLVASASTNPQVIRGEAKYGLKSLEWENVTLFACRAGKWEILGYTNTDDSGSFALTLPDDARLPVGVRQMYVSIDGDRSGADFVALVAPDGRAVMFSDVDGTLTSSENAVVGGAFGADVQANPGAPEALSALVHKGYPIVYVTAMARTFTNDRRAWLADKGFPLGALRLAEHVLLPGSATVDYKTATFRAVAAAGLVPAIGIGNRASDASAYHNVGVRGDRIFLKLGEFTDEDQPVIDAGGAVGVSSYADDLAKFTALPDALVAKAPQAAE
jgi:hypothetical protein